MPVRAGSIDLTFLLAKLIDPIHVYACRCNIPEMFDVIKESLLFQHNRISGELQDRANPSNLYDTSLGKLTSELTELRHVLLWRKKYPEEDITTSPYSNMLWGLLEKYEKEQNNEWAELNKIEPQNEAEAEDILYKKREIEKRLTLVKNLKFRH